MDKVQNGPSTTLPCGPSGPSPLCLCLSAAALSHASRDAQFFLKNEKSLLSRSARRCARLDGWPPLPRADTEEWAERHSSWYLSINCWSITRCMSSCGPRQTRRERVRGGGTVCRSGWMQQRRRSLLVSW